ncbi:MAG TPA: SGNH/GDSL hydrolase family protein [Flavobacteriales bacterium]|nr:SGNH/GDSL hydrolase family protein [Flavobacteriales bacterium]
MGENARRVEAIGTSATADIITISMINKANRITLKRIQFIKLLVFFFMLSIGFIIGETLFSLMVETDADNNVWYRSRLLRPYHAPVMATKKNVDEYLASTNSFCIYDPLLGWCNNPSFRSEDGNYCHDMHGIRTADSINYTINKEPNTLRIALLGDSYIYGAEVNFENTIGCFLEKILRENNIDAEVLNFGVGAYGIDQAYLCWEKTAYKFEPDIVIFGFQPENVARNVNLIRALYSKKEALPFFKPRFVLDGKTITLINAPTPIPDSLPAKLKNMAAWNLSKHETFYNPDDYMDSFWLKSKIVSYGLDLLAENRFNIYENERPFYSLENEPSNLTLKIIDRLRREVQANGADFFIMHIPRNLDINVLLNDESLSYEYLYKQLMSENNVIHPESELIKAAKLHSTNSLYAPSQHYSKKGNFIIATETAKVIIKALAEKKKIRENAS